MAASVGDDVPTSIRRVITQERQVQSHTGIVWLLIASFWFRRLYERVLQIGASVGIGTLLRCDHATLRPATLNQRCFCVQLHSD
jgi:hypothetical protein